MNEDILFNVRTVNLKYEMRKLLSSKSLLSRKKKCLVLYHLETLGINTN